jgi:DNA primase
MIPRETVDRIIESCRIEEVVGDFITLKKRGVNYIGSCPFHNEKTPSFTVSPVKGIYKCFGCSAGGNSVNFVMEHEHSTYPEALRYLAAKYHIPIEEEELSPEDIKEKNEREELFIISAFAQRHYTKNLFETEAGQNIGLTYFKERGFNESTIEKFQLGYAVENYEDLLNAAHEHGYNSELLVKTGLAKEREGKFFDFFRDRVVFPIHNHTGKVIAFGARTLKTDKKIPKYLNSPETEIYNKSKTLYGLAFAKKSIIANDNCFLVEGYTDVVSLYQAGVENAVASSGTSLTTDQIRLIKRFTPNITILYDGDNAGIKASFRGIDMILEEGMNVKVVLFPDGDDPDSYSKKVSTDELHDYISKNAKDFIVFKTSLLMEEAQADPIKKAGLIHEIVNSIALVPDQIIRSVYVKECSKIFELTEQTLINELNKQRRKNFSKQEGFKEDSAPIVEKTDAKIEAFKVDEVYPKELELIRKMIKYGHLPVRFDILDSEDKPIFDEENNKIVIEVSVAEFVIYELKKDNLEPENKLHQEILKEYVAVLETGVVPTADYFLRKPDPEFNKFVVDIIADNYLLSDKWKDKHRIFTKDEEDYLSSSIMEILYKYKLSKVMQITYQLQEVLKEEKDELAVQENLGYIHLLNELKKTLAKKLGIVVIK